MNAKTQPKISRWLPLWLVIIMISSLIFAPAAQAIRYLSDGSGGSSEGDPLDANDFSSGGGGLIGDDIQDNYSVSDPGAGGLVITAPVADGTIYVIVDLQGVIPVLKVVKVSRTGTVLEAPDAR